MRALCIAVLVGISAAGMAQQNEMKRMPKDAHPSFEVANIKLAPPDMRGSGFQTRGRRIIVLNQTVESMLQFAYGVQKSQLIDTPEWFHTERYIIEGYPDVEGQANVDQMREMVQKVLADRFALKFHKSTKELPVYSLTVAKSGSKMKPNTSNPDGLPDQTGNNNDRQQEWKLTNCSMDDVMGFFKFFLDRPVVNNTHLTGRFDFSLKWSTSNAQNLPPDAPPDFFTAIQEQAGLKAEATKAPVEVLMIDKAERPTEN